MTKVNYKNAYAEVYEILSYLDEEEFNKIPPEVIETIRVNKNDEYEYEVNEDLDLQKQPMLPETKAILFNLFRDYLSTHEQKEKILKMQAEDRRKAEIKKQEIYGTNNLFKQKQTEETKISDAPMIEYKESIFVKIKKFIKRIFNIKH